MPLTRLPPQFLLPAWSAYQLAVVQRAFNSTDSKPQPRVYPPRVKERGMLRLKWFKLEHAGGPLPKTTDIPPTESDNDAATTSEGKPKRTSTYTPLHFNTSTSVQSNTDRGAVNIQRLEKRLDGMRRKLSASRLSPPKKPQSNGRTKPEPSSRPTNMQQRKRPGRPKPHWPKSDSALSLFDELFPEEMLAKSSEQTLAEQRLDKLPAFNWTPDINVGDYPEEKIDTYNQIPQPDPLNPATLPTEYTPVTNISQLREGMRQTMLEDEQSPKGPSVLVLNACSKNLEESDFFRISPKGEHIEGWKSGLLKVIPSRDNKSFEPLGSYFLLFSSDAAARAYLDQTMRLHTLTRLEQTQKQARFPLPPGYLKEEENVQSLLKSFSLVPGFVKLSMRMLSRPYSTRVQTLINEGGPVAVASKEAKAQHMVLFTTDRSHITHGDVADALRQDGKRRNMHWNLAGDRRTSIIRIQNKAREEGDNSVTQKRGKLGGRRTYDGPGRFIITFKDSHEARRFVREWHCRPLHIQQDIRAEDEPPPIVNAEILW